MNTIKGVYREETRREDTETDGATVGYDGVTRIERREENYGDHGLSWFDAFKGDHLHKSFNARAIAAVHYQEMSSGLCGEREVTKYAEHLAVLLHAKHYPEVTQWRPMSGDLPGLLTQIDNMTAGMVRASSPDREAAIRREALEEAKKIADNFADHYHRPMAGNRSDEEIIMDDAKRELAEGIAAEIGSLIATPDKGGAPAPQSPSAGERE